VATTTAAATTKPRRWAARIRWQQQQPQQLPTGPRRWAAKGPVEEEVDNRIRVGLVLKATMAEVEEGTGVSWVILLTMLSHPRLKLFVGGPFGQSSG
jgi:hypothetical protein